MPNPTEAATENGLGTNYGTSGFLTATSSDPPITLNKYTYLDFLTNKSIYTGSGGGGGTTPTSGNIGGGGGALNSGSSGNSAGAGGPGGGGGGSVGKGGLQ